MNFFSIFGIFLLFIIGIGVNSAHAQIDPISDLVFFQSGELDTDKNQFLISDDFKIREFFNGNIIRVSGQTVEGFPYIIYSKISNNEINTFGKIFINGEFVNLVFNEIFSLKEPTIKNKIDDLSILVKYSQRVYSNEYVIMQIKTFDPLINTKNDFTQNYGMIPNTEIQIEVKNDEGVIIFSEVGVSDDEGYYETQFRIPVDRISTYIMTIVSSDESSETSKILQIIHAGPHPSEK